MTTQTMTLEITLWDDDPGKAAGLLRKVESDARVLTVSRIDGYNTPTQN